MSEAAPTFVRWLWIWITVLALVVVVVVGFLLGIVSSLESIDKGLFSADNSVKSVQGETKPLPDYIQQINGNLTNIDTALKPIRGQAGQILGALRTIQGSLTSVDSSLVDTEGSLVDTSGKLGNITGLLVNTSGTLGTITSQLVGVSGTLGVVSRSLVDTSGSLVDTSAALELRREGGVASLVRRIDTTLKGAQSVNSSGTNAIWRRVRFLNGGVFARPNRGNSLVGADQDANANAGPGLALAGFPATSNVNGLTPVEADAAKILAGLMPVNGHLTSICRAPVFTQDALIPTPLTTPLMLARAPDGGKC